MSLKAVLGGAAVLVSITGSAVGLWATTLNEADVEKIAQRAASNAVHAGGIERAKLATELTGVQKTLERMDDKLDLLMIERRSPHAVKMSRALRGDK